MHAFAPSVRQKLLRRVFLSIVIVFFLCACEQPKIKEELRPVRTLVVEARKKEVVRVVPGLLAAHRYVNDSFKIGGRLLTRAVTVGSTIKTGQLLAKLDGEIEKNTLIAAEAELTAARASLDQAESLEKRAIDLYKTKAISQNEFDEATKQAKSARAMVRAAEAKTKNAKEQLTYAALFARTDGIVTDKFAEEGEMVAAGHPIVRIAETETLDAVFDIPADFIHNGLATGWKIALSSDAAEDQGQPFAHATVYEVAPEADTLTRTYQTKAIIDKPCRKLLLGATILGKIVFTSEERIEIPASALTAVGTKPAVWVVAEPNSTVQLRSIEVGEYTSEGVVVRQGLAPREVVVTAGVHALHEGQKVAIEGKRNEDD